MLKVHIQFMLINSPVCSTCLFSWYRQLIIGGVDCVACIGGDFSQSHT